MSFVNGKVILTTLSTLGFSGRLEPQSHTQSKLRQIKKIQPFYYCKNITPMSNKAPAQQVKED